MPLFPSRGSAYYGQNPLYTQLTPRRATRHAPDFLNPCYSGYPTQSTPPRCHFSIWNAAKETVKGVFRPVTTMLKHPFKSAFAIGATVTIASIAPVTVPLMVLAGIGIGGMQVAHGIRTAIGNAQQGNYRAAEKAFGQIGEGSFSVISSLFGVRQAGAIAAEAKASNTALSATATAAEKLNAMENGLNAAQRVQSGSWSAAFQETLSVVTSSSGRKATATQLHPARVATLAKGKFQAFLAMFKDSPVVDMEGAVQDAQRYLKISNADKPEYIPYAEPVQVDAAQNIPMAELADSYAGYYQPKSHTIHIQPDRWKAFRNVLDPTGRRTWLDKLPKPLQNFLGNRFNQRITPTELATHEMTHARQFLEIRKLSLEQAKELLQKNYPLWSEKMVDECLSLFSFNGQGIHPAKHRAGEQTLLNFIQYCAKQEAIENHHALRPLEMQRQVFSTYFRAPHEVEARQVAAEALIADAVKKLKQAQSLSGYQEHVTLQQYRGARIEAKLNQLLAKFNRLERAGAIPQNPEQAASLGSSLVNWAKLQHSQTTTHNYLYQEQMWTSAAKASRLRRQASEQGFFTTIKNMVSGFFSRIVRFFTPAGLQQCEEQYHSLRPSYIAFNHVINQQHA